MAEIVFQGHGSFRMMLGTDRVIYIDPFAGEGYDLPADLVLVSHEHGDHNQVDLVTLKKNGRILRAGDFLKDGDYQEFTENGVTIRGVQAYNKNHPKNACVGFLVRAEGKKIYFAGDTSRTEAMEKELAAEQFHADGRMILRPGEKIVW